MKSWLCLLLLGLSVACGSKNESAPGTVADVDAGAGDSAGDPFDAGIDSAPRCGPPPDPMSAQRGACTFVAGAKASDTLGISDDFRRAIPIKHIIVVMKENRSFDHLFGALSTSGQTDAEPVPATWVSIDANGAPVAPFHATTSCFPSDPPHQWDDMHTQSNGGKMDGFVKSGSNSKPATDGHFTMGHYDSTDLPFYYWLANTYAIADHYFPSVLSGTWSNRDYLVAATSHGTKNTQTDPQLSGVPLIFDELDTASVAWQIYTDDLAPLEFSVSWSGRKNWGTTKDFFAALKGGTLPAVSFVDATTGFAPPDTDEHPPADVQLGEGWTRALYEAVHDAPSWSDTALFFTYDEAGGFGDHVPPPKSCAPSADQSEFTELGIRVPMIVISPYARRHFVSHAVHQHTSVTRFIEMLFDVPALTARDANSDALLDMFDFGCPDATPVGDAPAAGTGECPGQ